MFLIVLEALPLKGPDRGKEIQGCFYGHHFITLEKKVTCGTVKSVHYILLFNKRGGVAKNDEHAYIQFSVSTLQFT